MTLPDSINLPLTIDQLLQVIGGGIVRVDIPATEDPAEPGLVIIVRLRQSTEDENSS